MSRFAFPWMLALLLGGCGHTPVANEHSLVASALTDTALAAAGPRTSIVIATCIVPATVDRPHFVVSQAGGTTRIVTSERWSEPLKLAIPRALAQVLMQQLPGVLAWSSNAAAPARPDVRLDIEVLQWRFGPQAQVEVDLLWTMRTREHDRSARTRAVVPAQDASYAGIAHAYRAALSSIGEEIARSVGALLQEPQQ